MSQRQELRAQSEVKGVSTRNQAKNQENKRKNRRCNNLKKLEDPRKQGSNQE